MYQLYNGIFNYLYGVYGTKLLTAEAAYTAVFVNCGFSAAARFFYGYGVHGAGIAAFAAAYAADGTLFHGERAFVVVHAADPDYWFVRFHRHQFEE